MINILGERKMITDKKCINCKKLMKGVHCRQKYCSHECSSEYHRKKRLKERITFDEKCSDCKKKATAALNGKFYCSNHFLKHKRELDYLSKEAKEYVCRNCGIKFKKLGHRKFCSLECRRAYRKKNKNEK